MSLVDWAVIIMGGWTVAMVATGLVMALRPGTGELQYETAVAEPLVLRQAAGVMPRRAWGFRPPVHHSQYDPAPWQGQPPQPGAPGPAGGATRPARGTPLSTWRSERPTSTASGAVSPRRGSDSTARVSKA